MRTQEETQRRELARGNEAESAACLQWEGKAGGGTWDEDDAGRVYKEAEWVRMARVDPTRPRDHAACMHVSYS